MEVMKNWYVITGGPSSGKTATVKALEEKGYRVVPESARILIDQEIAKGKTLEEIRVDEMEFQKKVFNMKVELEDKTSKDEIVFFDRGLPDSIAYYQIYKGDISKIMDLCKNRRYNKIFFLEQIPFKKDYARIEDEAMAKKISILLKKAYLDLGHNVIIVPIMSVQERVNMILSKIKRQ